jgi:hypothetical protein
MTTRLAWLFPAVVSMAAAASSAQMSPRLPPVPRSDKRVYVEVETTHQFTEACMPFPWTGVHLSHEWHLNQARTLVPAIHVRGLAHR